MKRRLVLLSVFLLTSIVLAACAPVAAPPAETAAPGQPQAPAKQSALEKARAQGVIVTGIIQEPPSVYIDTTTGEATGFDFEVAKYVFKEIGVPEVQPMLIPWDGLIPALLAGRIDAITAGMAIKPERVKAGMIFSNPFWMAGPNGIVAKGNPFNLHKPGDLTDSDAIVCVTTGGMETDLAYQMVPKEEAAKRVKTYADQALAWTDLAEGRCDIGLGIAITEAEFIKNGGYEDKLELASPWEFPLAWTFAEAIGFRAEDKDMVDLVNGVLEKMKTDGTLKKIAEEQGYPVEVLALPCAEKEEGCYEPWATGKYLAPTPTP